MKADKSINLDELFPMLLYGLQRTSTNYINQLIVSNYGNTKFFNDHSSRFLPTHKHFRLYEDKFIIPSRQYYNSYYYNDFQAFRNHVERLANTEIKKFVIAIKHPYSWYLSFTKHAKKNGYELNKKGFNPHFIWDYNHFYLKWLNFKNESPEEIEIIKYEDVIDDVPKFLADFGKTIRRNPNSESIHNPSSVFMSKKFTTKKRKFYSEQRYMNLINEKDKIAICEILDEKILQLYNLKV